ncbi:ATP-binding protein [Streptomyces sp. PSKA54]|uniref:ATP-binding protein n=1 Tax=Streptomyces himalayensis subsp. aureolus TaxID=2758039 RepID=A0A7W2D3G3_9ACTN|nr:ATP-binding protein [Streptomyces himalayensis]MBA4864050.1 ATP-binding protein [Streptomyces himalayensis subsp. aureolus]
MNREPQTLGDGTFQRLERILVARGMNPKVLPDIAEEPECLTSLGVLEAGMPPRYRMARADHPEVLAWVRDVTEQAAAPNPGARRQITTGPSLLMAGVTGAGKTHQAYGAVRALVEAGIAVRWRATTAADLYADLRPRPGHDTERELAAVSRYPLLILDDLGAAKASEWVEEITYRLINKRYNLMLPTLITTNLAMRDLRDHLGDRVASRLAEMTTRVVFEPIDRRRQRHTT